MTTRIPKLKSCLLALLGAFIQAFGVYQIHSQSFLTEGGILGAGLLLRHWCHISPAISGIFMNGLCYLLGYRTMGRDFLLHSLIGSAGYSLGYGIFEQFPPIDPLIGQKPLLAAILGALFVGVGSGLCVRAGGAITGDDALAMSFSRILKKDIRWIYLFSDLVVLALSLSYIPVQQIAYSLLTVFLSGQLIGLVQKIPLSQTASDKAGIRE